MSHLALGKLDGFSPVAGDRHVKLAYFAQTFSRVGFLCGLIRVGEHAGKPSSFEHWNIRSRADQSVHDAAAHSQRLRAIATAVKFKTGSRFESQAKLSVRIEMVKLLKEWIIGIAQLCAAQRLPQQLNCFADHGNRPKRLNVLRGLSEV